MKRSDLVAYFWLASTVALMWATAWVSQHWDRSPLACAEGYNGALSCGRPVSTALLVAGFVAVSWLTVRLLKYIH